MPNVGDVVLYRLVVSEFYGIEKEKKHSFCKIRSLEGDGCEFKVPYENVSIHMRTIPNTSELENLLNSMKEMHLYQITRTAVDKICRPVINSFDMEEWMHLLLSLFADKKRAGIEKRKFSQKESMYYHILMQRFVSIFSYVFKKDNMQIEKMLLDKLEAAT